MIVRAIVRGRTMADGPLGLLVSLLLLLTSMSFTFGQEAPAEHRPRELPRFPAVDMPAAPTFIGVPDSFHDSLKRRDNVCGSGSHACTDLGDDYAGQCCPNDRYCYVVSTTNLTAGCCSIGNTCSPCGEDGYLCDMTSTVTTGSVASTITESACCPISCTSTSQFYCPVSFATTLTLGSTTETTSTAAAGGCCAYDWSCGVNGTCFSTATPTTSAATSGWLTEVAAGCSTGQITCSPIATGCCDASMSCTLVASGTTSEAYCVDVTVTPTGSGIAVAAGSGGLSGGAKGGIAAGVVIGAGLLIGAVTWAVLRRRQEAQSRAGGSGAGACADGGGGDSGGAPSSCRRGLSGRIIGGAGGVVSPGPSGGARQDMTDVSSDVVSRGDPLRGIARDYFGPDAVPGPYTDTGDAEYGARARAHTVGTVGGVPLEPQGPEDFVAPVEIDSSAAAEAKETGFGGKDNLASLIPGQQRGQEQGEGEESTEGRFELYGSSPEPAELGHPLFPDLVTSPWTPSPGSAVLPAPSPDEGPLGRTGQGGREGTR